MDVVVIIEDVRFYFGVLLMCLVVEMCVCFDELLYGDDRCCYRDIFFWLCFWEVDDFGFLRYWVMMFFMWV